MKQDDKVRVWPHGEEQLSADGAVLIISENQRSIAVAFGDPPPFQIIRGQVGTFVHPAGIVLLARREELDGKPWGPWVEIMGGGHYEIEPR